MAAHIQSGQSGPPRPPPAGALDVADIAGLAGELDPDGDNDPDDLEVSPPREPGDTGARRIIAIGGGKGGVGKSLLAANLGIYLAQLGKRTVLVDADLGGANLHTFVGVDRPSVTLGDLFNRRKSRMDDCIVETAITGLGLLSGVGDPLWVADPRPATKRRLLDGIRALDVDFLICDLPPGCGFIALDFFLAAHVGVLVVVPEPTSAENAYRFIKSAFLRRLRLLPEVAPLLERLTGMVPDPEGGLPAPLDLFEAAQAVDPAIGQLVGEELRRFRPRLLVNQTRTRADLDLGPQMRSAGRRRMGLQVEYLGHLESDDAVLHAVRKRHPLLVEHPESKVAKNIERVARKLISDADRPPRELPRRTEDQTLYEVLEIDPGASDDEIRKAMRRMRETYAPDSMVVSGLFSPERLRVVHRRVDEAYDTLLDRERRRRHDLKLFPDGIPAEASPRRPADSGGELKPGTDPTLKAVVASAAPEITAETEFTGPLLQRVRESRQLELVDIATRTKIGVSQLRAIEAEQWDTLPATVYLRGFLIEYAKCLRLDATQVARSYLTRYGRLRPEA